MARERRAALAAALLLALVVVLEFLPALSLQFTGDDFELLSLARIGGFSPRALVLPHRGAFVKPVLNAAWAAGAALFGAHASAWYTLALLVHLLNATLLGLLAARLAASWTSPGHAVAANQGGAASGRLGIVPMTGLATALVWAVHDRLSEPVFSIASLNHSITFALYLAALLAAARALAAPSAQARLLTGLFVLLTLFSYEVGASVLLALALLTVFAPGERSRAVVGASRAPLDTPLEGSDAHVAPTGLAARVRTLGVPVGAAALAWAVVQGASRLAPGAVSYYAFSPSSWLTNFAEIGLGFLHVPSYRIEPYPWVAVPFVVLFLAGALWPRMDRIVRFGCAWALAASLPVLPIPFFSDRYHYIVFAGLALAVGRLAALAVGRSMFLRDGVVWVPRRRWGVLGALVLFGLAHLALSVAGAREQARYYVFKNHVSETLLEDAEVGEEALAAHPAPVLAVVWKGDPAHFAKWLQFVELDLLMPRFSEVHSVYVRPQAVMGAVYPSDLFNVAAADWHGFYRRPAPVRAAEAIAQGTFRVVDVGARYWGAYSEPPSPQDERHGLSEEARAKLASRLRDALLTRREIPLELPGERASSGPAWNVAWLETTDRAGAFEAEYGNPTLTPPVPPEH